MRDHQSQLASLIALRWRMVRSRRVRGGLLALGCLVPLACVGAALIGQTMSGRFTFNLSLLAPTAMLGFAVLAVIAPLAAGGGNELWCHVASTACPGPGSGDWPAGWRGGAGR
jgi:hypothetical protein